MNKLSMMMLGVVIIVSAAVANAQGVGATAPVKQAQTKVDPAKQYESLLSDFEKEFVGVAEAMPAEKYDFAPSSGEFKGVRTFGEQVKHIVQANLAFGGAIEGKKPDWNALSEQTKSLKTKDELVAALKKSFVDIHAAFQTMTPENAFDSLPNPEGDGPMSRAGLAAFAISHGYNHYGQLVEYLRMNGIVPPASRK